MQIGLCTYGERTNAIGLDVPSKFKLKLSKKNSLNTTHAVIVIMTFII